MCYVKGKVNVIIGLTVLYSGYLWTMDNAVPNLYVTGKINVILGFTMWHFQKSDIKVCRWRRSLSCLSQEYLKKIPNTWDNFFHLYFSCADLHPQMYDAMGKVLQDVLCKAAHWYAPLACALAVDLPIDFFNSSSSDCTIGIGSQQALLFHRVRCRSRCDCGCKRARQVCDWHETVLLWTCDNKLSILASKAE